MRGAYARVAHHHVVDAFDRRYRSPRVSPHHRTLHTAPPLRVPPCIPSVAKVCVAPLVDAAVQPPQRRAVSTLASIATDASQETAQAFDRLCSIPGVTGHVRRHCAHRHSICRAQVALQRGEYGRGMMLTQPVQSGTSAAPGIACSVPLHLSLVLVKEKEMFSRGPLEWHERYVWSVQRHLVHQYRDT